MAPAVEIAGFHAKNAARRARGWMRGGQEEPPARSPGFQPQPHRWIVERTLAWIGRNRRMSKDDEFLPATSEVWVYLSLVRVMRERLAHEEVQPAFHYRQVA